MPIEGIRGHISREIILEFEGIFFRIPIAMDDDNGTIHT